MQQQPVAVADIGSNTAHLLVAGMDGQTLTAFADVSVGVDLGSEVERSGGIGPAKLDTVLGAVQTIQAAAAEAGAPQMRLFATEAIRAANNRAAVLAAIKDSSGLDVTVLAPEQEAALAFAGAALAVPGSEPRAVVDIGGGSVQVIVGAGATVRDSVSLPLGGGRLVVRFLPGDPPAPADEARLAAFLAETIPPALPPPPGPLTGLIGAGGALRRVAALLGHSLGEPLPADAVDRALTMVQGRAASELVAEYGLEPQRIHLLLPAILLLREVARHYGRPPLTISAYGLREGLILRLARPGTGTGGNRP